MIGRTTPEQRAALFEDAEALITTGFLSTSVRVGQSRIALRTLHPWDVSLLRIRSEGRCDEDWKLRAVASAIWLVGDEVLLGDPAASRACISMVGQMPSTLVFRLFGAVLGLFAAQTAVQEAIGVFVYEQRSRDLWKMLGEQPWLASGMPNAAAMGSNWTQRWWAAYNRVEDERLRIESQWDGFKLAASAQAPQAVRKIDEKDRSARDREVERRQGVLDQYYWYKAGVVDREGYLRGTARWALGARPIMAPKTSEELAREYQNWVDGKMDDHDRVVAGALQAAMEREKQAREKERQAIMAEIAAERDEPDGLRVRSAQSADTLDGDRRRGTTFVPDVQVAAGRAYWQRRQEAGKGYL